MKMIYKVFFLLIAFALPSGGHASDDIQRVESQHVCMINNKHFGIPQIPVVVEGKTYYGCCPMCEAKLKASVQARIAADPVSGNAIDKASAVIGALTDGSVLYFENEETFLEYKQQER